MDFLIRNLPTIWISRVPKQSGFLNFTILFFATIHIGSPGGRGGGRAGGETDGGADRRTLQMDQAFMQCNTNTAVCLLS